MTGAREIAPRMLNKEQAASYCGLSAATFASLCPLSPVSMGPGVRLDRWDVRSLDGWLDTFSETGKPQLRPRMAELRRKANARVD